MILSLSVQNKISSCASFQSCLEGNCFLGYFVAFVLLLLLFCCFVSLTTLFPSNTVSINTTEPRDQHNRTKRSRMPIIGPKSPDRLPITDPLARPIKPPFRPKTPFWACLHWLLHIVLIAASIAVIFYALVMGRVFIQPEDDFKYASTGADKFPTSFPSTPTPTEADAGDGGDGGDGGGGGDDW